MKESAVEKRLVKRVKEAGGLALKFVSPGCTGVPDRIVVLPGGRIAFVECKRPGELPRPLQLHWIDKLRGLGFTATTVDSYEAVDRFMEEVMPR